MVASKTQSGQGTESAVHGRGPTLDSAKAATVQARGALARRNWHTQAAWLTYTHAVLGWGRSLHACNGKAAFLRLTAETCPYHVA